MSLFFDVLIIVLLFSIFAISHSFLAYFDVKKKITERVGEKIAFYRLFYNISSIIIFIAIYALSPKPNLLIYDLPFPYDIIIFGIQVLGIIGFFWASSFIDLKEFLGLTQIKRYYEGKYKLDELDEHQTFIIAGPFKFVRHPIYFFSIIILGFRPTMDLFYLTFFICAVIYFYIGSIYEEKNLVKRFGTDYLVYKTKVPRLIPNPFSLNNFAKDNL